jgi:hypothetical protein
MDRTELGERLCQWHSSMGDPIYAVGSFYVSGQVYPDKEIVENAISSLTSTLEQSRRMLIGEKVMVERQGRKVDLKVFAGYTNEDLHENISDLEEIVEELQQFLTEDYQ